MNGYESKNHLMQNSTNSKSFMRKRTGTERLRYPSHQMRRRTVGDITASECRLHIGIYSKRYSWKMRSLGPLTAMSPLTISHKFFKC